MVLPCPGCAFLSAFSCGGNHQFLWVSEVTLESFWLLFGAFSVLHCHGVSLSGSCFSECFLVRRKSSFSMGFRSYVRKFLAAFWCLLRTAMVFPLSGMCFFECFLVRRKTSLSMGFRSYAREFLAAFWCFTAMVFPCPGGAFLSAFLCGGKFHTEIQWNFT